MDLQTSLALGSALVRNSRISEGIELLSHAVDEHPADSHAWAALLDGLETAGLQDQLALRWDQVPPAIRADPSLARHAGNVAWARGDRKAAITAFRLAWSSQPDDLVAAYRLARALHAEGQHQEAARIDQNMEAANSARAEIAQLYAHVNSIQDLGKWADPALFERIANNREKLGRPEEAKAWRSLALGR